MKMAATYWRSRSHPSNFLHLKWIGDCSACCQMKSNSISNNTPKRVGHNFVETCCFCAARNFVLSIPYVCVFFFCSGLGSRNWKAKLGLQLRKWKLHLYTMHSSCPKFRVLPRSKDPLDSLYECVCGGMWLCVCVCRTKLSTHCLWLELRDSNRALPLPLPRHFVVVYRSAKVCDASCKVSNNFSTSTSTAFVSCSSKNY